MQIDLCVLNLKLLFFLLVVEGGTLLPRIPYEEGFHRLVVRIDQIGLKDAHVYLNPFFTVSVKGSLRAQFDFSDWLELNFNRESHLCLRLGFLTPGKKGITIFPCR